MSPPYEIGAAAAAGWASLVVMRDDEVRVVGPWEARQFGAQWATLEAVERAIMLDLDDVARTLFVAEASVVSVCQGANAGDGFAGLRLRLTEGLFNVRLGAPGSHPTCLTWALQLLLQHLEDVAR